MPRGCFLLLSSQGELVETLGGAEGVPAGIRAIGVTQAGQLAVRASHGDCLTDKDLLHWKESEENEIFVPVDASWAQPATLPPILVISLQILIGVKSYLWNELFLTCTVDAF